MNNNNLSEKEDELEKSIQRFDQGLSDLKRKCNKVKILRKQVEATIVGHKVKQQQYFTNDLPEVREKLDIMRDKVKDIENRMTSTNKLFHFEMDALDGLNNKMQLQIEQVSDHITRINRCSDEWEFANKLTTKICEVTRHTSFNAFKRWSLLWPTIQLWLSTDSHCVSSIYGCGYLEGLSTEIITQLEYIGYIERFKSSIKAYSKVNKTSELTSSFLLEQKKRSDAFNELHKNAFKRYKRLLRHCESLRSDIEQREEIRSHFNQALIDLSSSLSEDIHHCMNTAEIEATKPLSVVTKDLHTTVTHERDSLASTPDILSQSLLASRPVSSKSYEKQFPAKNRLAVISTPIRTIKNTIQNSNPSVPTGATTAISHRVTRSHRSIDVNSEYDPAEDEEEEDEEEEMNIQRQRQSVEYEYSWYLKRYHYSGKSLAKKWLKTHSSSVASLSKQLYPVLQTHLITGNAWGSEGPLVLPSSLSSPLQESFRMHSSEGRTFRRPLSSPTPGHPRKSQDKSQGQVDKSTTTTTTATINTNTTDEKIISEQSRPLTSNQVSPSDIATHTGLISRQQLRQLQCTTFSISRETVNKISTMLNTVPNSDLVYINHDNNENDIENKTNRLNKKFSEEFKLSRSSFENWLVEPLVHGYAESKDNLENVISLLSQNKNIIVNNNEHKGNNKLLQDEVIDQSDNNNNTDDNDNDYTNHESLQARYTDLLLSSITKNVNLTKSLSKSDLDSFHIPPPILEPKYEFYENEKNNIINNNDNNNNSSPSDSNPSSPRLTRRDSLLLPVDISHSDIIFDQIESFVNHELYMVSLNWSSKHRQGQFLAKTFIPSMSCYKVFEFFVSEVMLKEITRNSLTAQLLNDQLKTYQHILSSLNVEKIISTTITTTTTTTTLQTDTPPSLQELEVLISKTPKTTPKENCKQVMTMRNKDGELLDYSFGSLDEKIY